MGAQPTVKAAPEFVRILQDAILGSELGVPDHLSWKMFVYKRADCRTRPTVETFKGGIHSKTLKLFSEFRIY
jgi:hypothetical protein